MDFSKFHIVIPPQDIKYNPECLRQIAAGDRSAFEWLYKNYSSKLYDYLLILTNDPAQSEDIVQDIFLKLWKKRAMLTTIANFNAYIFNAAKNLLLDRWRGEKVKKKHYERYAQECQLSEETVYHDRQQLHAIDRAIKTLSPRQELVYRLIREEGHTRDQVSKQLNICPNTVKATMQNALSTLRKQLCKS